MRVLNVNNHLGLNVMLFLSNETIIHILSITFLMKQLIVMQRSTLDEKQD